jgi:16S rRNA (guanine1207-N2)-methyltransferase
LLFPFERGEIDPPAAGQSALIIGALHAMRLPDEWVAESKWVQGLRPNYLALQCAGLDVTAEMTGQDHDIALVLCGRHRGQNEHWISEALKRVRAGGLVVIAGGKNDGIDSLRKRVAGIIPIEGSLSKYHGTVFWLRRPLTIEDVIFDDGNAGNSKNAEGFNTAPGMFAHKKADIGSLLLAETLPKGLAGAAADFGAGWGYLSAALLRNSPNLASLDLCEADFQSLQAAKKNIGSLAGDTRVGFYWIDLLQESTGNKYDLVVMNPPFHQGRAAEPDIGTRMILAASKALKPGGRLFMVANKNLPYEKTLGMSFSKYREIANADGYKVIHANR